MNNILQITIYVISDDKRFGYYFLFWPQYITEGVKSYFPGDTGYKPHFLELLKIL